MKTGLIVLDGPDASGKTTLANAFAQVHGAEIIHLTYNDEVGPRMFDYQTENLFNAAELSNERLVVVDRHWVTEALYANTFREGSPWPHMGRMMDRVFMKHAAIYVVCVHRSIAWAMDFHKKNIDPNHPYADDKFKELVVRHQRFALGCKKRFHEEDYATWYTRQGGFVRNRVEDSVTYHMDVEGKYMSFKLMTIMEKLKRRQESQYKPAIEFEEFNVLGHVKDAQYLMIGDAFNPKGDEAYSWPFYEYGNSSLYLAQAMQIANAHEDLFMWTNAVDIDGVPSSHIKPLVHDFGLKPIAMGHMAEEICKDMNITPLRILPHPAHTMRFLNPDPAAYADFIKQVMSL